MRYFFITTITLSRYVFDELMIVCLFACYYYYYLTQYAHARTQTRIICVCEGQRTDEVKWERSSPLSTPPSVYTSSACHPRLHTAKTSPPACHIVNDWGFFYATPSDGIYTGRPSRLSLATVHQFLSVRCSTPRDARTKRQHNTHCELYGGLMMPTSMHHYAAAALNPRTATLEHSSRGQLIAA